jgi:hypothetical protein
VPVEAVIRVTNPLNDVATGEAEICRAFVVANAMSPYNAKSLDDLAITHDAAFASLLNRGIVRRSLTDPGKFYALPDATNAFASREQRQTVIAALRTVIAIAVALFIWRILNQL